MTAAGALACVEREATQGTLGRAVKQSRPAVFIIICVSGDR